MFTETMQSVTEWYMGHINYFTVTGLMAVESSFVPFPSEIVIPPAAYKAAQGDLNVFLVVIFGTLGAILGALFNYYLALFMGRALVYKFADTRLARFCNIDSKAVEKAENYFVKYGKSSTFVGRLVPVIRQLISIPAGLSRMNIRDFILFTAIGSGIWNIILALLGYYMYSQKDLLEKYYAELTYVMLSLGIAFIAYLIYKAYKK